MSLLLLLQTRGRMSARALAEELEVSERTIYRDVDALSAAGVPVYAERGRRGGCALIEGYRTDVTGLTADEARALFIVAAQGALAADLGLGASLQAALRKLLAGLPAQQRPDATAARGWVVVDPRGWMRGREASGHLATVQRSVWERRRLRMRYRSAGAPAAAERIVAPYGLVAKAGTWYLIAAQDDEPRLYRVSRIEEASVTDEAADVPESLDLDALWERLRSRVEDRGPGVKVSLRVRAERLDMLLRICGPQLTEPAPHPPPLPDASGWVSLDLAFVAEGAARASLIGFGADAEVLAPPTLRRGMRELAVEVLSVYSDASEAHG